LVPSVYGWARTLDGSQIQKYYSFYSAKIFVLLIDKFKKNILSVAAYFVSQELNFESYNEGGIV
jgi:hypothetical protein